MGFLTKPLRAFALGAAISASIPLFASQNDSAGITSYWPSVAWPFAHDPALEQRIDAVLEKMSLEAKVGQLIQGDIASIKPEDLKKYPLGSILAGGNSDPDGRYDASAAEWLALADAFYAASVTRGEGEAAIPVIFGIDAVHGQSNIKGATLFPHNIGLGATRNVELMREIGQITAIETRVTGMEWAFAPTVAVPQDDRWGRTYEGYSESAELVASFSAAVVEGLQGNANQPGFLDQSRVMASVKHFVGDGGTVNGKDQGDTAIDAATLAKVHGAGYPPAIAAGAQSVMASFNSVGGVKMHGHQALLTDALKGRMNFGGFVVGDWNGHGQVNGCTNEGCPQSINAGVDMLMAPDTWKANFENTLRAAKSGQISTARLNDAVRRILRVKFRLGLFDQPKPSARLLGGKFALIGAPAHRAVARRAVRESLVLLKNQDRLLPLDPRKNVLVLGSAANDVSKQAGGWTLNWQGTGTKRADFPNADTLFEAIQAQVNKAGGKATFSEDGRYSEKPDVAVVVFGEDPYAEFQGDIPNLAFKNGDASALHMMQALRAADIPVVSVFYSGRPLWVNREINASTAFVAAWLPGSEAGGIADVLLRDAQGEIQFDFKGTLSFSWPKTAVQFANNVGQPGYDPQFAFAYGLNYQSAHVLPMLSEDSGLTGALAVAGKYFQKGQVQRGASAFIQSGKGARVAINEKSAATPDGSLTWQTEDDQAQQDARRISWQGKQLARFSLQSDATLDLRRESNADLLMVLRLRVLRAGKSAIWTGSGCEEICHQIDLSPVLRAMKANTWSRLGVPLKCFANAGADLSALRQLLSLQASKGWEISISDIELGALNEAEQVLTCPKL
jgi:beta-glucosidase